MYPYKIPLNQFPVEPETNALKERLAEPARKLISGLENIVGLGDDMSILFAGSFNLKIVDGLKRDAWNEILPLVKKAIQGAYDIKISAVDKGDKLARLVTRLS